MDYTKINEYLVSIFNRVQTIEATSLKSSQFYDVSLKEMHTIDIIGKQKNVTPSDIASELMLTLGTVTTSLNRLETKGYIQRNRSNVDRRVVHLVLTKKGKLLYRLHSEFHKSMVKKIIEEMNEEEMEALLKGLISLHQFLEELL
ncbi:MAG: MarR family transcriptional regulator [Streptococcus sp.]|nr:MarR family transcriptional regulator [Streptococcus sp.]